MLEGAQGRTPGRAVKEAVRVGYALLLVLLDDINRALHSPQAEQLTNPLVMAAQNTYVYQPEREEDPYA